MSLDVTTIKTAVQTAVGNKLIDLFITNPPAPTPEMPAGRNAEESMLAIAEGVAEAVPEIINAIKNDAEVTVTDVTAGTDTAAGGIA